jgi:mannan endo-1,4-beta-mannosidase
MSRTIEKVLLGLFICSAAVFGVSNFSVKNSKIYGPDGREFVPRGVNVNGINWAWPGEVTQDGEKIIEWWKFNAVRINCFLFNGTHHNHTNHKDNNDLDSMVRYFTSRKIVAMIDFHDPLYMNDDLFAKDTPELKKVSEWFAGLAEKYIDNPYVWFDCANEPGGSCVSSSCGETWVKMHQNLIRAIRETGNKNIITVEGWNWGQDGGARWSSSPVPTERSAILSYGDRVQEFDGKKQENVIFHFHTYDQWNYNVAKMKDYVDRVHANGWALINGEFGVWNGAPNLKQSVSSAMQCYQENHLGFFVWSWYGGDGNQLVGGGRGGNTNDKDNPTNLTWMGSQIWNATHTELDLDTIPVAVENRSGRSFRPLTPGTMKRNFAGVSTTLPSAEQYLFDIIGLNGSLRYTGHHAPLPHSRLSAGTYCTRITTQAAEYRGKLIFQK